MTDDHAYHFEKKYTQSELDDAVDNALNKGFENALKGIQAVYVGFEDTAYTDTPQEWADSDKPLFNIQWCEDRGDPSVGINGFSGWVLAADQLGTHMHEIVTSHILTRKGFFLSGPKHSSAIVYDRESIEPVIVALAAAHGFTPDDYTASNLSEPPQSINDVRKN